MTDTEVSDPILSAAKTLWWLVLLRGILAIAFGIIALIAPAAALTAIALVYGAYTLVDGVATVVHALQVRSTNPRWGWLVAIGVVSVLAGFVALILPGLVGAFGGLVVLWTIVVWAIANGVMALRSAGGEEGRARTLAVVAGIAGILLGVVLAIAILIDPEASLLSLIWTAGVWAIIFGIVLVVLAFTVRKAVGDASAGS